MIDTKKEELWEKYAVPCLNGKGIVIFKIEDQPGNQCILGGDDLKRIIETKIEEAEKRGFQECRNAMIHNLLLGLPDVGDGFRYYDGEKWIPLKDAEELIRSSLSHF